MGTFSALHPLPEDDMASLTAKTRSIRRRKKARRGIRRKRQLRAHGSTPSFAIVPEGWMVSPSPNVAIDDMQVPDAGDPPSP